MSNSDTLSPSGIVSVTMQASAKIQIMATPTSPPQTKQALLRVPSCNLLRNDSPQPMAVRELDRSLSGGKQETFTETKNMPIEAWYYNPNSVEDPEEKDPTMPHHFNPDQRVPEEHLKTLGVLVWTSLQTKNYKLNQLFQQVKSERGYNYEEVVTVAPNRLANYKQKKREFFKEHLHEHEEIRLILEGSGYEDVRDFDGHWIRIHITKGVLIVLPKGMYHRFTLDDTNYLKAVLLYQETPSRIQFDRSKAGTDIMEVREKYVSSVLSRGTSLRNSASNEMSKMLEGLDEEMDAIKARQEIVEASLDESNSYADSVKAAQAIAANDEVCTRLALVAQKLQAEASTGMEATTHNKTQPDGNHSVSDFENGLT